MSSTIQATILVVEDEPVTLTILLQHLKRLHLQVSVARNGEEALRQVRIAKPDLILLDIMMPGIDGFETCRRLKSNIATKDIPVIFLTALTHTADKVKAFEVGGVDYIMKPAQFQEIAARVNTRLTIQKLQKQLQAKSSYSISGKQGMSDDAKAIVLIVEDNPMTLRLLRTYLDKAGFGTLAAPSGEEALQQMKDTLPDIILLDVVMPGIDGFETCRHLKNSPATKDIPVIFMTALSDTDSKVKAFEMGGADYITKPHHYAEVVARVTTHLTLRTLQRQLRKKIS